MHAWAFPEPEYAWKLLKDLGVDVIQVSGEMESNVLHIHMNDNHPYGGPQDAEWALNLNRFLDRADSYGMKIVFQSWICLGDPMYASSIILSPWYWDYTSRTIRPSECLDRALKPTSFLDDVRLS